MKGGRKNLKRASKEDALNLEEGQSIMQVVSLRGSNIIEVMDAGSKKSLALFPTKFQKSMWIKRGSFVVVDGSGRDKVLESGNKVASIVSQVLFHKRVRVLQVSPEWPQAFRKDITDDSNSHLQVPASQAEEELNSSDVDDGLPPLEANLNGIKPADFPSDSESESESDSNADS